ncbi:MAG: hypothetical protein IKI11_10035 [Neisseriaceae bacterium]|nr:hypothetical protein [Neisseriaceae bacterium]
MLIVFKNILPYGLPERVLSTPYGVMVGRRATLRRLCVLVGKSPAYGRFKNQFQAA